VAVLRQPTEVEVYLNPADLSWKMTIGSGPGGQNRNKTETAVILTHRPSGITVRCENERSQVQNKRSALGLLRAKLLEQKQEAESKGRNDLRKGQIGCGARGDKVRTIAMQRGQVTDHRTGQRMETSRYLRGYLEDLFPT